jgi:hypothetical protein
LAALHEQVCPAAHGVEGLALEPAIGEAGVPLAVLMLCAFRVF